MEDPQPVGSKSHYKKKNSIFLLHELLRYWPTASKIYRRVVCLSFLVLTYSPPCGSFYHFLLSLLLSPTPLHQHPTASTPWPRFPFRFSLLRQQECKSEDKQRHKIKKTQREREREQRRKTVCYSDHKRLFLLYPKKRVYH